MQLAGSHTFKAPRQVLWNLLNDPDVLARTTPGIESLEQTDADQYQAVLQVKMGPINSAFNGTLHVVDKSEPESYRLLIDVDGKIGQIKAEGSVIVICGKFALGTDIHSLSPLYVVGAVPQPRKRQNLAQRLARPPAAIQ